MTRTTRLLVGGIISRYWKVAFWSAMKQEICKIDHLLTIVKGSIGNHANRRFVNRELTKH